jgi:pentatricopeptide repeat protein
VLSNQAPRVDSPEERTAQLHQTPIGSLTAAQWKDGLEALTDYWTCIPRTDCVEASFQLLERLVDEYRYHRLTMMEQVSQAQECKIILGQEDVLAELLRKVVLNWAIWRRLQPSSADWSPSKVLKLIDTYKARVDSIKLDIRVFSAIMAAWLSEDGDPSDNLRNVKDLFHLIVKDGDLNPDTKTFDTLMQAYVRTGSIKEALAVMDSVIELTSRSHQQSLNLRFGPTSFEAAMRACADSASKDAGFLAQMILDRMHNFYCRGILSEKPNVRHHNAVINAWAKSDHPSAGATTEALMDALVNCNMEADSATYSAVIHAWAKQGDFKRAEAKLVEMCDNYRRGNENLKPDEKSFSVVLDGIAKSRTLHAGKQAEKLLKLMWLMKGNGKFNVKPNKFCYSAVMNAWASSGHPQAGAHAEQVFYEMQEKSKTDPDLAPNTVTYNVLLHTFAKVGNVSGATEILSMMCSGHLSALPEVESSNMTKALVKMCTVGPDRKSFNAVLNAIAKSKALDAGEQAEKLLALMWSLSAAGKFDVKPNTVSYTSVINAWASSAHPQSGTHAERIFNEMLEKSENDHNLVPNTRTYNTLLRAWAKVGNSVRVAEILNTLCNGPARASPDVISFNTMLHALAKKGGANAGREAETLLRKMWDFCNADASASPNVFSYNRVIHAWGQSHDPAAGRAAIRLLEEMHQISKTNPGMKPNVVTYTCVIDALASSGHSDAGLQAESILQEARHKSVDDPEAKPNITTYNCTIEAWVKSGHQDAGSRALRILEELESRGNEDASLMPNERTYDSVLRACAVHGQVEQVEYVLSKMVQREDLSPTDFSFNILLQALVRSPLPDKGQRADYYLGAMESYSSKGYRYSKVRPSSLSYKLAQSCWRQCPDDPMAKQRLRELKSQVDALETRERLGHG